MVEEIEYNSASDFINGLLKEESPWGKIIYRGQGGEYSEILPSAFRKENEFMANKLDYYAEQKMHTNRDQVNAEFELFHQFKNSCNQVQIELPNFHSIQHEFNILEYLDAINRAERAELTWPIDSYLPIFALAQHNGLPTRLIDWTFSPLIAAFFAAQSDIDKHQTICVYSCDSTSIRDSRKRVPIFREPDKEKQIYSLYESQYSGNTFISAQKGLFTVYCHENFSANSKFEPLGFLEFANKNDIKVKMHYINSCKITELLKFLDKLLINHSTVFPNIENVVMHMRKSEAMSN